MKSSFQIGKMFSNSKIFIIIDNTECKVITFTFYLERVRVFD